MPIPEIGRRLFAVLSAVSVVAWVVSVVSSKHHHAITFWLVVTLGLLSLTFGAAWLEERGRARRLRSELETAREALTATPPTPLTSLERWFQGRIAQADALARQRGVRGDDWYFAAMNDWDFTNLKRLAFDDGDQAALAPDLAPGYRDDPRTGQPDGSYPPHDTAEQDRYYGQRKAWLDETFRALRAGTLEPPAPQPEVPEKHRDELQAIAAGLDARLDLERPAVYAPVNGQGKQPLAKSFRTHFPSATRMLDEWDSLVAELDEARSALHDRVSNDWPNFPILAVARAVETASDSLPWTDTPDYLLLGEYVVHDVEEGVDWAEFKRPYNEAFVAVLETSESAAVRRARLRLDAGKQTLHATLERIEALHVIRGRCELCT